MTRVLILGNSHAATLRLGFGAIRAAYPGVRLSFWGLPGASFAKASVGKDGRLAPDPADAVSLRKAASWNDEESIDLLPFDRIFLVGMRYNFRPTLQLMRRLQPLDWGRRRGALGVCEGMLRASIRAMIDVSLNEQAMRTPFDTRFVAMPAPYPATRVMDQGPLHEPVTKALASLTQAPQLAAVHDAELRAAHEAIGLSFVPQPPQTIAAPFLSDPRYLADPDRDARHMNADYGFAAFEALLAHSSPIKETEHALGS